MEGNSLEKIDDDASKKLSHFHTCNTPYTIMENHNDHMSSHEQSILQIAVYWQQHKFRLQ